MKPICVTFALAAMLFLASCTGGRSFDAVMKSADGMGDMSITVILPDSPRLPEITLVIGGVSYKSMLGPTVSDPSFVFEDNPDDGIALMSLILADSSDGTATLRITDTGGNESAYTGPMSDFRRLTDYLGSS